MHVHKILVILNYKQDFIYLLCRSKNVSVYLGYRGHPFFSRNEASSKIYYSNNINIHEDYEYLGDGKYLNNIALIQISTPVTPSSTIRPGELITKDEATLLAGTFLNITGWFSYIDTNLKVAVVKLRSQDACEFLFGRQFLKNQEMCINWNCTNPLDYVGNPVSLNSKIIGYQVKTPPCLCTSDCTQGDVFLSFIPFLDWISEQMDRATPSDA